MPWTVVQGGGDCADNMWAVIADESGETVGCYATQEEAQAQQQALYSNVPDVQENALEDAVTTLGRWEGPVCIEGEWTGDERLFEPNAIVWDDPATIPQALRWAEFDHGSHDGARSVGWAETLERRGDVIWGSGTVYDEDFWEFLLTAGQIGVSADMDMVDFTVVLEQPDPEATVIESPSEPMTFHSARLRAMTAVDIPAFTRCLIKPVAASSEPAATVVAAVGDQPTITHSGIALVALDTGRVLLQQRAVIGNEADPEAGKWEFPGGGLEEGEHPEVGALREFAEETGLVIPPACMCQREWTDGVYMGHVYTVQSEADIDLNGHGEMNDVNNPDLGLQQGIPEPHAWFHCNEELPPMRSELEDFDWSLLNMDEELTAEQQAKVNAFAAELAEKHALTLEEAVSLTTSAMRLGMVPVDTAILAAGDMAVPAIPGAGAAAPAPEAPAAPAPEVSDADREYLNSVLDHHDAMLNEANDYLASADPNSPVVPWVSNMVMDISSSSEEINQLMGMGAPVANAMDALVAAAAPVAPPDEWFDSFDLGGHTPITVTAEGRVFGHIAAWGQCHADFNGQCVTPPHDPEAPLFHLGEVITASGTPVPVGRLTVGGGHAHKNHKLRAALEHYDNVSTCAAVVRAYEDEWGIGLFGSVVPEATPEQIAALRRSPLSADWRKERGKWRLVAAHAVNTPAYPAVRMGTEHALVASSTPQSFVTTGRVEKRYADGVVVNLEAARRRIVESVHNGQRADLAARITGQE